MTNMYLTHNQTACTLNVIYYMPLLLYVHCLELECPPTYHATNKSNLVCDCYNQNGQAVFAFGQLHNLEI